MLNRETRIHNASLGGQCQRVFVGLAGRLVLPWSPYFFHRACRVFRRLSPSAATGEVRIGSDARFEFRLRDPYWSPLLSNAFRYEPEIEALLRSLRGIDYVFYDCGANFGYWSLLVSGAELGRKKVVAVEALRRTYERACRNRGRNGRDFTLLHRALARESGRVAEVYDGGEDLHAGSTLVKSWLAGASGSEARRIASEKVETLSLDDLVAQYAPSEGQAIVIKLDVEGMEREVLAGSRRVLDRGPLLIYEDHGKDADCLVSRYVLEELKLAVFALDPRGWAGEIRGIDELRRLKTDPGMGYNFAAAKRGDRFHRFLARSRG